METTFDPYYRWLGIPPEEQPPNHYRLLGLKARESNQEVIDNAADRQMLHVRTFQHGPRSAESQRILSEIAAARACLSDSVERTAYDRQLFGEPAPVMSGPAIPPPPATYTRPSLTRTRTPKSTPPLRNVTRQMASIVAGGAAGIAIALGVLWFVFGSDPLGMMAPTQAPTVATANAQKKADELKGEAPREPKPKPTPTQTQSPPVVRAPASPQTTSPAPERSTNPAGATDASKSNMTSTVNSPPVDTVPPTASLPATSDKQPSSPAEDSDAAKEADSLADQEAVYLSDLPEKSLEYWEYLPNWGFGKEGKYFTGEREGAFADITLAGKKSPQGIFAHPKTNGRSNIEYEIGGLGERLFQATIGVDDARRYGPHTPLTFEVLGDGKSLWKSRPVTRWGEPQDCQVEMRGVQTLELRVTCPGDASFAMAVWCEPRLVKLAPAPGGARADEPSQSAPPRETQAPSAKVSIRAAQVQGGHLWWDLQGANDATALYGEITVLATHPGIYYCGANWHPGEPAGGYCGIQHNSARERRTIFSIWDTTRDLHPRVTRADPKTFFDRFGGEGEGAHTHMVWDWQLGETFQFFVQKVPGRSGTTDAHYFVYDRKQKKWRHSATIESPQGDAKATKSVSTIGGGGLASFLENFTGQDRANAKLALYRLWLGKSLDAMKRLTRAKGDGLWGKLDDAYFLAEGKKEHLEQTFAGMQARYGLPVIFENQQDIEPVSDRPVPPEVVRDLKSLIDARKGGEN
jgi:hypothetical protein